MKIAAADPVFDVVEDGYYVGFWFLAGREQDWLALLYKNPSDAGLQLAYRFRYYKDDKVFFDETEDEKSVYRASCENKTEAEAIAIVDGIADKLIAEGYLGTRLPWGIKKRYTRRLIRGTGHEFMRAIQGLPFVHMKSLPTQKGNS